MAKVAFTFSEISHPAGAVCDFLLIGISFFMSDTSAVTPRRSFLNIDDEGYENAAAPTAVKLPIIPMKDLGRVDALILRVRVTKAA